MASDCTAPSEAASSSAVVRDHLPSSGACSQFPDFVVKPSGASRHTSKRHEDDVSSGHAALPVRSKLVNDGGSESSTAGPIQKRSFEPRWDLNSMLPQWSRVVEQSSTRSSAPAVLHRSGPSCQQAARYCKQQIERQSSTPALFCSDANWAPSQDPLKVATPQRGASLSRRSPRSASTPSPARLQGTASSMSSARLSSQASYRQWQSSAASIAAEVARATECVQRLVSDGTNQAHSLSPRATLLDTEQPVVRDEVHRGQAEAPESAACLELPSGTALLQAPLQESTRPFTGVGLELFAEAEKAISADEDERHVPSPDVCESGRSAPSGFSWHSRAPRGSSSSSKRPSYTSSLKQRAADAGTSGRTSTASSVHSAVCERVPARSKATSSSCTQSWDQVSLSGHSAAISTPSKSRAEGRSSTPLSRGRCDVPASSPLPVSSPPPPMCSPLGKTAAGGTVTTPLSAHFLKPSGSRSGATPRSARKAGGSPRRLVQGPGPLVSSPRNSLGRGAQAPPLSSSSSSHRDTDKRMKVRSSSEACLSGCSDARAVGLRSTREGSAEPCRAAGLRSPREKSAEPISRSARRAISVSSETSSRPMMRASSEASLGRKCSPRAFGAGIPTSRQAWELSVCPSQPSCPRSPAAAWERQGADVNCAEASRLNPKEVRQQLNRSTILQDHGVYDRAEKEQTWKVSELRIEKLPDKADERSLSRICQSFGHQVVRVNTGWDPIKCKISEGKASVLLRSNGSENTAELSKFLEKNIGCKVR